MEVKCVIGLGVIGFKYFNQAMTVVCQFSSLLVRDLSLRRLSNHSDGTKRVSLICCQFIEAHGQYFLHHAYEFNLLGAQIDRINNQL